MLSATCLANALLAPFVETVFLVGWTRLVSRIAMVSFFWEMTTEVPV
ncbi:Uncharacterised protein [Mycobacteroides abscessus subsp. abscessus]|nr:Uncharacterised protein [Mycobacteroides abscessus subsp. abscessus]